MPAAGGGNARPARPGVHHRVRPHRERDPAVRIGFAQQAPASDRDQPGGLSRPANPRSSRATHYDPLRWYESELPTGLDHLPAALVHESMVEEAQKHEVGQLVRPTSRPGDDVMRRRPVELAIATGEPAAAIAYPQRPCHWS